MEGVSNESKGRANMRKAHLGDEPDQAHHYRWDNKEEAKWDSPCCVGCHGTRSSANAVHDKASNLLPVSIPRPGYGCMKTRRLTIKLN